MRKPLPIMTVLMSLIFIALYITFPLRNYNYTFLTSAANNSSVKPVIFHYDNSNNRFIDGLADFTYVAHRGAPTAANEPENSLSAFKASKKLGYKIVETDLQLTKDGQWVILHDYTLDRTSTGIGAVKSKSLKHIKKLSLKGSTKNERLSIPKLEEFLSLCSSEGLIPILDIKPNEKEITSENYNSLLMSLSKYNLLDKSIFTSSSKEVLTELRRRDNLTAIAVMMEASLDNLEFTKKLNNAFIYLSYENLTDEKINLINNNNLRFGVWTINDEKVAKHFLEKGALMIVTDNLLGGK